MAFTYRVKLAGFNNPLWAKELPSKLYRDLVKSLYNNDDTLFLQHLEYIIEHICPGILEEGLNIIDKIALLLYMRSICISPDLELKANCSNSKKSFERKVKLEEMISKIESVKYHSSVTHDNIVVNHSVIKAKDEVYFLNITQDLEFTYLLASSVDNVIINDKILLFNKLSFEERLKVVENLPLILSKKIYESIIAIETEITKTKLLTISSPYVKDTIIVDLPVSASPKVSLEFCKLLFNDDLNNLYKMTFNLVNKGNFSAEYVDGITPAEQLLYWSYFIQQAQKEQEAYDKASKGKDAPSFGGPNLNSNKESPSEFT